MRICVTGATGFIGGQLARALLAGGHTVLALSRPGSAARVPEGLVPVWGDLSDDTPEAVDRAAEWLRDVDVVYHLAALRDRWGVPYPQYYRVNVEGTRRLLEAAARSGVKRFVYGSSVGVAEYHGRLDADETMAYHWDRSKHPYHHTKMLAEQLTLDYARQNKLATTVVRPCITYGPGDTWGMMTRIMARLSAGRYLVAGSGKQHVHLVHVEDLVRGLILAGERAQANGRVYIVAGEKPVTWRELLTMLCGALEVPFPRLRVPQAWLLAAGTGIELLYGGLCRAGMALPGDPLLTRSQVHTVTTD